MSNIVTVNLDNLSENEKELILSITKKQEGNISPDYTVVEDGDIFMVGDMEFIKFPDVNGMTPAVSKDILFTSRFGNNNDLRESEVMKKLQTEVLPKIIEAVGAENLCTIKTDLTTLDGLKPYGEMESLISLPTFDFYRANVAIFDKHKANRWWWLATPDSAPPHSDPTWILCVAPSGRIIGDYCGDVDGVRPFLIFKSSIFESSEE